MHPAQTLVSFMKRIYDADMTTTSGGNLSVRDTDGSLWITPGSVDKGSLTPEDIVRVLPDGTIAGRHKPSSELPFHRHIYESRADIGGIVHAHPPALVGYSLARTLPRTDLLCGTKALCGEVVMVPYATPGSAELGSLIAEAFVKGAWCVMLENHGVVCGGKDLPEAFARFEALEYAARLQLKADMLGGARPYPGDVKRMEPAPALGTGVFAPDPKEAELRETLCRLSMRACTKSLFSASCGSFSARLGEDDLLILPSGKDRKTLAPGDIVRVQGGVAEAGKIPGGSLPLHRRIYRDHPEVNSLLLAQPPAAMAFACSETVYDTHTIPECYIMVRRVEKVPYAEHFADGLGASSHVDGWHPVLLIENDCVLAAGDTPLTAFDRLEVLDFSARALIHTRAIGPLVPISHEAVQDIERVFDMHG